MKEKRFRQLFDITYFETDFLCHQPNPAVGVGCYLGDKHKIF